MFDLTGKCALITGAAGGIGRAIAKAFAAQGATLALTDMNEEGLKAFAAELGGNVHCIPGNLGDAAEVERIAAEAEEKMGRIDILVNNAGLTRDNLAMRMKDEEWDLVLNVNLTAAFRLSRAVMRGMMKNRYGRIIGLASVVGATGNAGQANYAASKGGLVAMSKCLAAELASRNITVNCVAPGFIATPMTDKLSDEQKGKLVVKIPMGRLGSAGDVAACISFLASEEAGYVTGQTIHVNGGMAMI
ncbi:MAG TPA: 3-oxoacyl-[acyl-carrier-protein] reductase [Rhodospirillaceae bacterium]|nr:MAG: 3-oxoacyl-[acyl-carrier-protein] reductase [Alphaproteobacteria bacterium GWF2_58_20]HAU28793.1 3-oxoacyl-[acyl-carrier-protein] reductase [Rhodospirillaceae bacterium]